MDAFLALNSNDSSKSDLSVIAHIDLDAFYAQVLQVHNHIDPSEPVGCRQWNSLIAINYPARPYGLKRGVSVQEAKELCPQIHLPHVATFKKGESKWDFHDNPDSNNYKVSLDQFRRESRKIFKIFKKHFSKVEKAGVDEGFIDLGPEVFKAYVREHPNVLPSSCGADEQQKDVPKHAELIEIGAALVEQTRLQIKSELQYTCSAGISTNKVLAKLASGFRKPFNQTVVPPNEINSFLSNFQLGDMWGLGGKTGAHITTTLGLENVPNQFEFVRQEYSKFDLETKFGELGTKLYLMVRGEYKSEVKPRTMSKSMVAVKDFRKLTHLQTFKDVDDWLLVFAADLAGRLEDTIQDLGQQIKPQTISVKQLNKSKQVPFNEGRDVQKQIYIQSKQLAKGFIELPCTYLVVEISQFIVVQRSIFETFKTVPNLELPVNEARDKNQVCKTCKKRILKDMQTHEDFHYAERLSNKFRGNVKRQKSIKQFFN